MFDIFVPAVALKSEVRHNKVGTPCRKCSLLHSDINLLLYLSQWHQYDFSSSTSYSENESEGIVLNFIDATLIPLRTACVAVESWIYVPLQTSSLLMLLCVVINLCVMRALWLRSDP